MACSRISKTLYRYGCSFCIIYNILRKENLLIFFAVFLECFMTHIARAYIRDTQNCLRISICFKCTSYYNIIRNLTISIKKFIWKNYSFNANCKEQSQQNYYEKLKQTYEAIVLFFDSTYSNHGCYYQSSTRCRQKSQDNISCLSVTQEHFFMKISENGDSNHEKRNKQNQNSSKISKLFHTVNHFQFQQIKNMNFTEKIQKKMIKLKLKSCKIFFDYYKQRYWQIQWILRTQKYHLIFGLSLIYLLNLQYLALLQIKLSNVKNLQNESQFRISIQHDLLYRFFISLNIRINTINNKMQERGPLPITSTDIDRLILKISRLKNRLISYGISTQDLIDIILYDFLKAPRIDWTLPHNTSKFYQTKQKYCVDNSIAQLIMTLEESVPNWYEKTVLEYLNETITYNSLAFGIDLQNSDDSSNEDAADMTLLLIKAKKKNKQFNLKPKKRGHHSSYHHSGFSSMSVASNIVHYSKKKQIFQQYEQEGKKKIHLNNIKQKQQYSPFDYQSNTLKKQNSYNENSSQKSSRDHNQDESDEKMKKRQKAGLYLNHGKQQELVSSSQQQQSSDNNELKLLQKEATNFILFERQIKRVKPQSQWLQQQKLQKKIKKQN